MSEIDRQIEELHGQVKKAEALQQQTREAEGIARKRRRRCLSSQQQLKVARAKVKDYQTIHWRGIVDVLMGNRQAIYESLEQAYAEAKQHHGENMRLLETAEAAVKALQNQQMSFETITDQYRRLLKQKEVLILQSDSSAALHLRDLIEQQQQLEAKQAEQQQALATGKKALAYLKQVHIRLKKAKAVNPAGSSNQERAIAFWTKQMKESLPYAKKAHRHMRQCQSNLSETGEELIEALSQNGFLAATEMSIMKNGAFRISLISDQCAKAQAYVKSAVARHQKHIQSTETALHQLDAQYTSVIKQA